MSSSPEAIEPAVVIGKFCYLASIYYIWREAGRQDNVHPFYYGLTKDRCDNAPNCAYGSVDALTSGRGMYRVKITQLPDTTKSTGAAS